MQSSRAVQSSSRRNGSLVFIGGECVLGMCPVIPSARALWLEREAEKREAEKLKREAEREAEKQNAEIKRLESEMELLVGYVGDVVGCGCGVGCGGN